MTSSLKDQILVQMIAEEAGLKDQLPVFLVVSVGMPDGSTRSLYYPEGKVLGVNDLYTLAQSNLNVLKAATAGIEEHLVKLDQFALALTRKLNEHVQTNTGRDGEDRPGTPPASGGAAGQEEKDQEGQ